MFFAAYAGRVSDRIGLRFPLVTGMFGTGIALLLPYLFKDQLFILLVSQSLFGLCQIFTIVALQNLVGSLGTKESRSNSFATYTLGVSIANFLGPLMTGFSIDHTNFERTFMLLAIFSIVPGFFFIFNTIGFPKKVLKEENQKNSFVELLFEKHLLQVESF